MKLEILRNEIRIVPEGAADEVYLRHIADRGDQAKAVLEFDGLSYGLKTNVLRLVVKPFPYGEGPSVSS